MYLPGRRFELKTNHKPLEQIYSRTSKPCARIERWMLRLQGYDFKVVYRPGKTNLTDASSRLNSVRQLDRCEEYDFIRAMMSRGNWKTTVPCKVSHYSRASANRGLPTSPFLVIITIG